MAAKTLQSRLSDLSMSLVEKNRGNLLFGGTSKGEMDFLNNSGYMQSATPNFLAFMAGAAASNNTIQEQRQQQYDQALNLWKQQDATEANTANIANTNANTKLTNTTEGQYVATAQTSRDNVKAGTNKTIAETVEIPRNAASARGLQGAQAQSYVQDSEGKRIDNITKHDSNIAGIESARADTRLKSNQATLTGIEARYRPAQLNANINRTKAETQGQLKTNQTIIPLAQSTIDHNTKTGNAATYNATTNRMDAHLQHQDRQTNAANAKYATEVNREGNKLNYDASIYSTQAGMWQNQNNNVTSMYNTGLTTQADIYGTTTRATTEYNNTMFKHQELIAKLPIEMQQALSDGMRALAALEETRIKSEIAPSQIESNTNQAGYYAGMSRKTGAEADQLGIENSKVPYNPMQRMTPVAPLIPPKDQQTKTMTDGLQRLESNGTDAYIIQQSLKAGVDPELMLALATTESSGNPIATSPKGAYGYMQVMPSTGKEVAARLGEKEYRQTDGAQNIRIGIQYFKEMLDRVTAAKPNLPKEELTKLALASYNAGPGAVEKYNYTIPPYSETQNYVNKVTGFRNDISSARQTMQPRQSANTVPMIEQPQGNDRQPSLQAPAYQQSGQPQQPQQPQQQSDTASGAFKLPKAEVSVDETMKMLNIPDRLGVTQDHIDNARQKILSNPKAYPDKYVSLAVDSIDTLGRTIKTDDRQYEKIGIIVNEAKELSGIYEESVNTSNKILKEKKYTPAQLKILREVAVSNAQEPAQLDDKDRTFIAAIKKIGTSLSEIKSRYDSVEYYKSASGLNKQYDNTRRTPYYPLTPESVKGGSR